MTETFDDLVVIFGVLTGQRQSLYISAGKPFKGHWRKKMSPSYYLEPFCRHLLVRSRKAQYRTCRMCVSSLEKNQRAHRRAPF